MTTYKTCGNCRISAKYENELQADPFGEMPDKVKEWLRKNCCVCTFDKGLPLLLPLDTDPDYIPCDFWEE